MITETFNSVEKILYKNHVEFFKSMGFSEEEAKKEGVKKVLSKRKLSSTLKFKH